LAATSGTTSRARRPAKLADLRHASVAAIRTAPGELLTPNFTHEGTVRRFLEEAVRQFGAMGYFGVSIREIAEPIGVKPSALYAHFPSKAALLREIITLAHEYFLEQLRDARDQAGPTPEAQLRAVISTNVRFHARYPLIAAVANQEMRALTDDAAAEVIAIRRTCEDLIGSIIEEGNACDAFACPNPEHAMRAIGSMCLRVAAWFDPVSSSADDVAAAYADFGMRIVSAPTPPPGPRKRRR
jgi:AcrR family transcriptional regulator